MHPFLCISLISLLEKMSTHTSHISAALADALMPSSDLVAFSASTMMRDNAVAMMKQPMRDSAVSIMKQLTRDSAFGSFGSVLGSEASVEGQVAAIPTPPVAHSLLDSAPHLPLHHRYVSALDEAHNQAETHDSLANPPGSPLSPMVTRYLIDEYSPDPPADPPVDFPAETSIDESTVRRLFVDEHADEAASSSPGFEGDDGNDGTQAHHHQLWRGMRYSGLTIDTAQTDMMVTSRLGRVQSISPPRIVSVSFTNLQQQQPQQSSTAPLMRQMSSSNVVSRQTSSLGSSDSRQLHTPHGCDIIHSKGDPSLSPLKRPRAQEAEGSSACDSSDGDDNSLPGYEDESQTHSRASAAAAGGRVQDVHGTVGYESNRPQPSSAILAPSVLSQDNFTPSSTSSDAGDSQHDGDHAMGKGLHSAPDLQGGSLPVPPVLPDASLLERELSYGDLGPLVDSPSEGSLACLSCPPACGDEDEGGFCSCPADDREWSLISLDQKQLSQQLLTNNSHEFASPLPPNLRSVPWLLTSMYEGSPAEAMTPDSMTGETIIMERGGYDRVGSDERRGLASALSPSGPPTGSPGDPQGATEHHHSLCLQAQQGRKGILLRAVDGPSDGEMPPFSSNCKCGWKSPEMPLVLPPDQDGCAAASDEEDDGTPKFIAAPPRRRSGSGSGVPPTAISTCADGRATDSPSRFQKPQPLKILDAFSSSPSVSALPSPSNSVTLTPTPGRRRQPSWVTPSPRGNAGFNLVQHLGMVTGGLFDDED